MTTAISSKHDVSQTHEREMDDVLEAIAALSSEALSHLMRESRIAMGYQCEDEWVIGEVRHRWRYFVTHCKDSASTVE